MTPIDYHDPNDFWIHRQPSRSDLDPDNIFKKSVLTIFIYAIILISAGVLMFFVSSYY